MSPLKKKWHPPCVIFLEDEIMWYLVVDHFILLLKNTWRPHVPFYLKTKQNGNW
jgi:hypothetical protein